MGAPLSREERHKGWQCQPCSQQQGTGWFWGQLGAQAGCPQAHVSAMCHLPGAGWRGSEGLIAARLLQVALRGFSCPGSCVSS